MGEGSGRQPARRIQPAQPKPAAGQGGAGLMVVVGKWTGALAGALRIALRDNISDYAERLGVGVSTADDWESNPDVVPLLANQKALDQALRRAGEEQKRRFEILTSGDPLVLVADLSGLTQNGDDTHRRDITRALGAGLVAALAPLDALERIAAQGEYPIDSGLVSAHEKFADALAELGTFTRPGLMVEPVAEQAELLLGLLDRPAREADRRRLEAVAVSSCAQAGMLAFCAGDRRLARRYFALACSVAEDSGDRILRARALGVEAVRYSPMPGGGRGGDPRRQVATLTEAVRYARGADPDTCASLHWWLATALAGTHDERGFSRAVGIAEKLAQSGGVTDGRGWLARHFIRDSGGQIRAKSVGEGLLLLGRPEPAVEAYAQALVGPRQGAWRAVVLIDTTAARVLQGKPEESCTGLLEALDLTEQVGYRMGVQRILGVRAQFPPEWADLPCVHDLDERVRLAA